MSEQRPKPVDLKLHQQSRVLEVAFDDGQKFDLTCEYLRVLSPSAEVRGHGPGQEVLQLGKENVNIVNIEQVGHYAVRLVFDDGHDSGLYSWDLLYDLGRNKEEYFSKYVADLAAAGHKRQATDQSSDETSDRPAPGSGTEIKI